MRGESRLLKSKFFWVAVLYFSEGFPFGVFIETFPVYFRNQGVELKSIGAISLVGLAWTLKFLWAPAVDYFRHHRWWMAAVDIAMGGIMLAFAVHAGLAPWIWVAIGAMALLSATNDVAIDGYTIELLGREELGLANGIRNGFYRIGLLASGAMLVLSDYVGWAGAFFCAAVIFALSAVMCLKAPREIERAHAALTARAEIVTVLRSPRALGMVLLLLGAPGLLLIDHATHWSQSLPGLWPAAFAIAIGLFLLLTMRNKFAAGHEAARADITQGPVFGALFELLRRPAIAPVLVFVLIYKLGDASLGFMVKPFWVDSGFSNTEIGLVSVNIGAVLSIAGGLAGGWYTDRVGIFKGLWVLGLFQAVSNLGYTLAAWVIPPAAAGVPVAIDHRLLIYGASAVESFTSGLGSAAFLAFLMAIVNKERSATEYALLSSVFAVSRSLAGWASGFGVTAMGYAPYFLLSFFLSFPAFLFLPWVKKMLDLTRAK